MLDLGQFVSSTVAGGSSRGKHIECSEGAHVSYSREPAGTPGIGRVAPSPSALRSSASPAASLYPYRRGHRRRGTYGTVVDSSDTVFCLRCWSRQGFGLLNARICRCCPGCVFWTQGFRMFMCCPDT